VAIQRIAAQLTRLASVEEVGAAICRETRQLTDYDEAHVVIVGATDTPETVAVVGAPVGPDGAALSLPAESAAGQAVASALSSPRPCVLPGLGPLGQGRAGSWSLLLAPMCYEGRVVGVVCLLRRGERRFDDTHLRVLQIIADQAAVAFENARLLAGRDELVAELEALLQISQAASEAASERQLADRLATMMCRAAGDGQLRRRRARERPAALEQLQLAADVDPLTGVNNHRYLQDRLRQEAARAARSRSRCAY
jgi:GAF domain-containing protein